MPIPSRYTVDVPRCSLQQWVFGSSRDPLPDRKAFIDPERPDTHCLTFGDYRLLAKRVALGLQAEGVRPGDRVLVFSGNNLYFPSLFMGVLMAGGIFTGANPTFAARELAYQLRDSEASILIAAETAVDTALRAAAEVGLPRDRIFIFSGDATGAELTHAARPRPGRAGRRQGLRHWTELLASGGRGEDDDGGNLRRAEVWSWEEPADPEAAICCLNYSSGTTGLPKGVMISHRAYVANGVGVVYLGDLQPDAAAARARARALCFLPMYHAFGQTYFIANYPRLAVPVYVMPAFDFLKMLEYVQRYRITSLTCVPPILVALSKHPAVARFDLSSVEAVGCGAAPLSREVGEDVKRLWEKKWPQPQADKSAAAAVQVRQGWGMTEMTCTCISWAPTDDRPGLGGVGEVMPNCAARLVRLSDDDDGSVDEITQPDTPGELWVTGPTMMRGYWRNPAATAATVRVDADGTRWLRTGDVAYVEGRYEPGAIFHIVDRVKELIKVRGNQVAPAELEALLLERADVADAAVVGVTVRGEEVPRAYVVRAAGSTATGAEVAAWVRERVVSFKQLRGGVVFVDEIPKNPSGKILRKILRERAKKEVGDRVPPASKLA